MGYIIKMPKLGMSMQEGILLEWTIDVGDTVEEGDVIAEIESEKSTAEITAREGGALQQIYIEPGESVEPGTPMGIVAPTEEDINALEAQIDYSPIDEAATADETVPASTTDDNSDKHQPEDEATSAENRERVKASPKARKRASELSVKLSDVNPNTNDIITVEAIETAAEGSAEANTEDVATTKEAMSSTAPGQQPEPGEPRATPKARKLARELDIDLIEARNRSTDTRITSINIETAAAQADASEGISTESLPAEYEDRELSSMRRTIAKRLGQSSREAAHVTVHRDVPVNELQQARSVVNDYLEEDTSLLDILLVLVSETLLKHPAFNATFDDEIHRVYHSQNIGVAVDIDRGLITPVLTGVDSMSLAELTAERRRLTDRAISGEFTADDLTGGTFTISNLGILGTDLFTPIINPPQVAILGVNRVHEVPIRTDDGIEFEPHMNLSLSFDHRVVDGADAARFLDTLARTTQDPWTPLLDQL